MFWLGIAPKDIFLAYSTQFVFSTIRLVTGNLVMVAINMCGKSPITGEWIYGITWKHVLFNIFVLFIVDTTSILKLVFPTVYCFCLDGYVGGCVVAIIVTVVGFIYLFIYFVFLFIIFLQLPLLFFFLLSLLSSLLLLLLLGLLLSFVCVVIVAANLMLMFSILVLLFISVNSVNK